MCVVTATIEQGQGVLMATTRKYLNHLLQSSGITPACSEEERAAAEDLAQIFTNHGFTPEVQEFNASATPRTIGAVLGIVVFVGAVLMGVGGIVGIIGFLLVVVAAALYMLERMGRISFGNMGASGLSQNVIAYHQASGPLASPRNRPVVVVAHYDSPRADLFSQMPYATYKPLIVKLMPYMMVVPAVLAIVRLLPFPGAAKTVFWIVAILAALVPLAHAVGVIANRFVLPYTSGSVCNKSSVASMLGVMDAVAPYQQRGEEFPHDVPFEDYFSEQIRMAQAAEVEAAVAAGDLPADALRDVRSAGQAPEQVPVAPGEAAPVAGEGAQADATLAGTASLPVVDAAAVAAGAAGAAADMGATKAMNIPAANIPASAEVPASDATAAMAPLAEETPAAESVPSPEGTAVMGAEDLRVAAELPVDGESAPAASASDEPTLESQPASKEDEPAVTQEVPQSDNAEMAVPAGESEEPAAEEHASSYVNAEGNYRYGEQIIRAIGMVPENCVIEYDLSEPSEPEPPVSVEDEQPVAEPLPEQEQLPFDDAEETAPAADADETAYINEPLQDDAYDYQPADTFASDEYADDDAFESYQPTRPVHGDGLRGAAAASGVAETLSAVGASAKRFFGDAFRKGKSMLDSMTSHNHDEAEQYAPQEGASADVADNLQPAGDDTSHADQQVDAASVDATVSVSMDDLTETAAPVDATNVYEPASEVAANAAGTPNGSASAPAAEPVPVEEQPVAPAQDESATADGATQVFDAAPAADATQVSESEELDATVARTVSFASAAAAPAPAAQDEAASQNDAAAPSDAESDSEAAAVDALMAEITAPRRQAPRPAPQNRAFSMVPDPSQPSLNQMETVNRSSLFDLPDPSTVPVDPFAVESNAPSAPSTPAAPQATAPVQDNAQAQSPFSVISAQDAPTQNAGAPASNGLETISSEAPAPAAPHGKENGKRGLGKLFHHKKQEESSMSDWLGVDESFDAKNSGRDIGSWDNFEGDDWKGGATGPGGTSVEELRDAVTSMGDDELLGHDIWFVATGASEYDNAGIQAFLDTHRDKLRGVFLINLESVGAGDLCMLATEGGEGGKRVLKGDKRIMNLVRRVSGAFHREFATVDMPYLTTDAYRAMSMSLRSLTIAGVEGNHLACSHTEDDLPYRINEKNVRLVADVVAEVIRRS